MDTKLHPWSSSWKKGKEIKRGGQGIISIVTSLNGISRKGVIKQIVPRWADNPQARKRLELEAETLQKLHDAGARVPEVYDDSSRHERSEPFVLMEFIPGVSFDEWLTDSGPVSPQKAAQITLDIAQTIILCHKNDVGHRDIKPANIILKDGKEGKPYVLDFGISFDSRNDSVMLTRKGEMFWNEFIILPECQDLEGGQRDLRSDICALVGIFYTCITGFPPLTLRNAKSLAPQQRNENLIFSAAKNPLQGEKLMWFFDTGFQQAIDKRFQTIDDFTEALEQFLEGGNEPRVDLASELDIFNDFVEKSDRSVQIDKLSSINTHLISDLKEHLTAKNLGIESQVNKLSIEDRSYSQLKKGTPYSAPDHDLVSNAVLLLRFSRQAHANAAGIVIGTYGVGMQIHLYVASYTAPATSPLQFYKDLYWERLIVVEEGETSISKNKLNAATEIIKQRLGSEIRELIRLHKSS